jgi:hypothetical protein
MPNNNNNLINEYFDKSYITSILCELSYNYYSFLYQILMFPTILSSSVLTVLNSSSIDEGSVKIINIVINGMNTILLSVNSNFKLNDRCFNFKTMKIKFTALNHYIEKEKNKKINDPSYIINIEEIINNFDNLYNDISYQFPTHIKNKIIKKYGRTRILPNSLAVENLIDVVNVNCDITIPDTNSSS